VQPRGVGLGVEIDLGDGRLRQGGRNVPRRIEGARSERFST